MFSELVDFYKLFIIWFDEIQILSYCTFLINGHVIVLEGFDAGVRFGPPVTPRTGILTAGRWVVGEHIDPGNYTVKPDWEGDFDATIYVLGPAQGQASQTKFGTGDGQVSEVYLNLQSGQELVIALTGGLTFTRR